MRTLTVELDRPGAVTVIYGDGSGSGLEIERSEPLREHSIPMSRLAPSSQYSFQVLSDADQYAGDFTTAGLPTDLAAIDFTATGTPTHPLTLVELHPFPFDDPDFRGAVFGVTRRPSGNFVFMDLELGLLEVTPAGSVVSLLVQEPDGRTMHHDVTALSDGGGAVLEGPRGHAHGGPGVARRHRWAGPAHVSGHGVGGHRRGTGAVGTPAGLSPRRPLASGGRLLTPRPAGGHFARWASTSPTGPFHPAPSPFHSPP